MGTIYRKTAEGQQEIDSRGRQLGPRLRTALIMVDGRRSDEDLRKLIAVQADETLQTLLEHKLIEVVSVSQTRPPSPVAPAAVPSRDFPTLRRDAVRAVNDLLGPMGEMIAMKLEQAKNAEDLRAALERAVTVIGNARGGAAAVQFARQFIEAPVS
jgi:hypothetical protein